MIELIMLYMLGKECMQGNKIYTILFVIASVWWVLTTGIKLIGFGIKAGKNTQEDED